MTGAGPRSAALPMYDLPELQAANDMLWAAIAARLDAAGVDRVPRRLTRGEPLDTVWSDPDLLLAQTCGYPLTTILRGRVGLVATPHYRAEGCDGPLHRSVVVVRVDSPAAVLGDLRGARCAINGLASNTGMNLLRYEIAALAGGEPYFGGILMTGGHAASADAVASGEADVAAIDCVTWAHLQRLRPAAVRRLRVLGWTVTTPALPMITSARSPLMLRAVLADALADVARDPALREVRAELLLDGFSQLALFRYEAILTLEAFAVSKGYPILR